MGRPPGWEASMQAALLVVCCSGISVVCPGYAVQWRDAVCCAWGSSGMAVAAYVVKASGATQRV